MKINKTIYLVILLLVFSACKTSRNNDSKLNDSYLVMESDIDSPEIIQKVLFFYPAKGITNKYNFQMNSSSYNVIRMYLTKDSFKMISCCEFGEVQNLSVDTEKMLKTFSEKEIDSISKKYDRIFTKLNEEISIIKNRKDITYKSNSKLFRFFSANNLTYCDCVNGKHEINSNKVKPINEGFIYSIGHIENLSIDKMEKIFKETRKIK